MMSIITNYTFDGNAKSGEKQNLYINGQLETTKEHLNDSVGKSETSLWIGILNAGYTQVWHGKIDEVKIWKRALSGNEVQLSYGREARSGSKLTKEACRNMGKAQKLKQTRTFNSS